MSAQGHPLIVSASRRTDIPAFYTPWLLNRLREGWVLVRNPFNPHQIRQVSLAADDVRALVFWTRNGAPLLPHLQELDGMGHACLFHYTITGYPRELEPSVPGLDMALAVFAQLSDRVGAQRMIWRYDPIVLGQGLAVADHQRMFARIARALRGKTRRVVISFVDFYAKTRRNLHQIKGFDAWDIRTRPDLMAELLETMVAEAADQGMQVQSCCEALDAAAFGLVSAACLDARHLSDALNIPVDIPRDRGQRPLCGCVKSVDIGAYHSCLHGCAYCYATHDRRRAQKEWARHCSQGPFLVPGQAGHDAAD